MMRTGSIYISGTIYKFQITQRKTRSKQGIEGGRIATLLVTVNEEIVASYNGGWEIEPPDEGTELAVAILLKEHN